MSQIKGYTISSNEPILKFALESGFTRYGQNVKNGVLRTYISKNATLSHPVLFFTVVWNNLTLQIF